MALRVFGTASKAGILSREEEQILMNMAAAAAEESRQVLQASRELREILFRIFSTVACGETPSDEELSRLNAFLARALGSARVAKREGGYAIEFDTRGTLDGMLPSVVWSAAELLRSGDLARVKICRDENCGWLFVDESKNRSRRWCEMSDCGNRAKARRHYRRITMRARASGGERSQDPADKSGGSIK